MEDFAKRIDQYNRFTVLKVGESPYQSDDEYLMDLWLDEAKKKGLVKSYTYHPLPFLLFPDIFRTFNDEEELVFGKLIYTPDFIVEFTEFGKGNLHDEFHGSVKKSKVKFLTHYINKKNVAVIDVKPEYQDRYNSSANFRYIQRILFEHDRIYLNKTILISNKKGNTLFASTFTPVSYLLRAKKSGNGFLKVKVKEGFVRTSNEYIEQLKIPKDDKAKRRVRKIWPDIQADQKK